jgi:hypothetical protein
VALVVVANAMLWLSVLSPHDQLFTQFLLKWDLSVLSTSIFRACGAVFGVCSTFAFPFVHRKLGLKSACLAYIILESSMLVAGTALFVLSNITGLGWPKLSFLVAIIASRIGLYGFCIGYAELMQTGVEDRVRGQVSSIDKSFTKLAQLVLYGGCVIFSDESLFQYVIYGSACAVLGGGMIYGVWFLRSRALAGVASAQFAPLVAPDDEDAPEDAPRIELSDVVISRMK